jgi:thiol-disulfide isomerase/thioredoxin
MRLAALAASLYAAALLGATPAAALSPEARAAVEAARSGAMTRMVVHDAPRAAVAVPFTDGEGAERRLTDWPGKVVFVNFWATWCPPCLKEMPSIDRLSAAMEGADFEVIAISTDRGDIGKPRRWLAENGIRTLELFHDPRFKLAQAAQLLGQPTTLLLDREGREIARFTGDTEWDAPEAQALIRSVIAATAAEGGAGG